MSDMEVASHMPYAPNIVFRSRWCVGLLVGAFLAFPFLSGASPGVSSPPSNPGPASTQPAEASALAAIAARTPAKRVSVIVQLRRGVAAAEAMRSVRAAGGRAMGRLSVINGFGARLTAAEALELGRRADVRVVSLDGRVAPQAIRASDIQTAYPFSTGAVDAWNRDKTATGKGVGVAVIDTGIAGDQADFRVSASNAESRVVASAVVNPGATTAGDPYGHGTHVAGILAGNSWNRSSADSLRGRYVGVAPDADLISVKASDDAGNATVLDVIYGLQFVVDHKDELNIRVESTEPQSYKTDPLDAAVESA